jgi:hypothetical protein
MGIVTFPVNAVTCPTTVDGPVLGIVTFPADAECLPVAAVSLPAGIDRLVLATGNFPVSLETSKMRGFRPFPKVPV